MLKLAHLLGEAQSLTLALRASARKILVFISAVLTLVLIVGSLMHVIEGEESGFTSIPQSMYWAIVTMTTVGYGDFIPRAVPGFRLLAASQAFIGAFMIGLFIFTLARKYSAR